MNTTTHFDLEGLPPRELLVVNNDTVEALQRALRHAPQDLQILRTAIRNVLTAEPPAWCARLDPRRGVLHRRDSGELAAFIAEPAPSGLGSNPATIRRLLRDHPEELALFDAAIARSLGVEGTPDEAIEADTHDVLTTWQRLPLDTRKELLPDLLRDMIPAALREQVLAAIAK